MIKITTLKPLPNIKYDIVKYGNFNIEDNIKFQKKDIIYNLNINLKVLNKKDNKYKSALEMIAKNIKNK
tara:strand:+ start:533 stop:739 length:207 start_codon:yes stop_codon:yes gene_type:complete